MPMTIEGVKKAEKLIAKRDRIARAMWNSVVDDPNLRKERSIYSSDRRALGTAEAADDKLQWAIEEFRKRKLDAIHAQLLALGVEPDAPPEPEEEGPTTVRIA